MDQETGPEGAIVLAQAMASKPCLKAVKLSGYLPKFMPQDYQAIVDIIIEGQQQLGRVVRFKKLYYRDDNTTGYECFDANDKEILRIRIISKNQQLEHDINRLEHLAWASFMPQF